MMRTVALVALLFGLSQAADAASNSGEGSKGLTVEELGQGLKSAAQNIEKEIPKLGSAIGNAVKKMTGPAPDKRPASEQPSKEKK